MGILLVLTLVLGVSGIRQPSLSPPAVLSATASPAPHRVGEKVRHGQGYKQVEEGITVVHLKGSDAQIKAQYEALLAEEIGAFNEVTRRNRILRGLAGGGCTNFAAFGSATAGGDVWHGRTFDFYGLGAMDRYKVVYIVEPQGLLPYVSVGWAGWNSYDRVHTAMNVQGISLGYMWANSNQEKISDAPALWELFRRIIERADSLPEAIEIVRTSARASAANLLIADAKVPDAVVVEMTSRRVAVRRATGGVIYAANHFVQPAMREPIKDPNSVARYQRVGELLAARRGRVDLMKSVALLRDRFDARTRRETLSGDVIAWNIGVLAVVFSPSDRTFWVAQGLAPAVYSRFVGFSLADELAGTQATTRLPTISADPVVRSPGYQSFMTYQAGYIAALEGRFDDAIKKIREAIPGDPRSGRYRYTLATAYMNARQYPEAIRAFQEALATDMNDALRAYSYFHLGKIYEAMGNVPKMRESFARVLALAIGDPEIEDYARKVLAGQK